MSGKKKTGVKSKEKKGGKYDITVKVDATFDELLKAGLLPAKNKVNTTHVR